MGYTIGPPSALVIITSPATAHAAYVMDDLNAHGFETRTRAEGITLTIDRASAVVHSRIRPIDESSDIEAAIKFLTGTTARRIAVYGCESMDRLNVLREFVNGSSKYSIKNLYSSPTAPYPNFMVVESVHIDLFADDAIPKIAVRKPRAQCS